MLAHRGRTTRRHLIAAILLAAGCAVDPGPSGVDAAGGKADQIDGADDASGILPSAERRLSRLVTAADVGQTIGVDDADVPYPDTYWPMTENGIAVEWAPACDVPDGCPTKQPSPLAKYMQITDPANADAAIAWEVTNHGKDRPGVASWFGHCPGWTASAMMYKPIQGPTYLRGNGAGGVSRCTAGEAGCVKFEIGDLNGLSAEVHDNAASDFIGARCDTAPSEIARDEFGRIIRDGKGCKGLNPGTVLIVATNLLKLDKQPFGIDAQTDFNTDQIWNQPAYRYTVNRLVPLTTAEAANLVASGEMAGPQVEYRWNGLAKGFVLVDLTIHWITETPDPNTEVVSGLQHTKQTRMVSVIELDAAPDDPEAFIIGGELIDDKTISDATRLTNHPFLWKANGVGSDDGHNPFVRGAVVTQMLQLALER